MIGGWVWSLVLCGCGHVAFTGHGCVHPFVAFCEWVLFGGRGSVWTCGCGHRASAGGRDSALWIDLWALSHGNWWAWHCSGRAWTSVGVATGQLVGVAFRMVWFVGSVSGAQGSLLCGCGHRGVASLCEGVDLCGCGHRLIGGCGSFQGVWETIVHQWAWSQGRGITLEGRGRLWAWSQ